MASEPNEQATSSVDVQVQVYNPALISLIRELHESNQYDRMQDISNDILPNIGYVAIQNETPVAAGFLRLMEGGYGLMDYYVSNQALSSDVRHRGLELVTNSIVETAKGIKLNGIFAFIADKGIIVRAEATGFHLVNQSIYALPLKEF